MPLTFTVTREDMLRSKVVEPGWYKVKIKKVSQEPSNAGDSINTWVDMTILGGPVQKDGSNPTDVPVRRCFSEKAPGFIVPFLVACGASVTDQGGNFDVEKTVGKDILVYIKNTMYENQLRNDVADFKKVA